MRLPPIVGSFLLLLSVAGAGEWLILESDPEGYRKLELGYANGFDWKEIVGGHIWIKLNPFELDGERIEDGEFNVNRFVIRMPYDPMALDGKRASVEDGTLFHGEGGSVTIRHSGERLEVKRFAIEFKKVENWVFRGVMTGTIRPSNEPGSNREFKLDVPLDLQFGYGAPDGFPGPMLMKHARELMDDPGFSPLLNRGYSMSWDGEQREEVFLRMEFDREEDVTGWLGKLDPLEEGSYFALFELVDPNRVLNGNGEDFGDPFTKPVIDPIVRAKARADMSRIMRMNGPLKSMAEVDWWFGEEEVEELEFFRIPRQGVYGYVAVDRRKKRFYVCSRSQVKE